MKTLRKIYRSIDYRAISMASYYYGQGRFQNAMRYPRYSNIKTLVLSQQSAFRLCICPWLFMKLQVMMYLIMNSWTWWWTLFPLLVGFVPPCSDDGQSGIFVTLPAALSIKNNLLKSNVILPFLPCRRRRRLHKLQTAHALWVTT